MTAGSNCLRARTRLHWIGSSLALAFVLCACGETSFVSLGHNTRGAQLRADAGTEDPPPIGADAGDSAGPRLPFDGPPLCSDAVPSVAIASDCDARAAFACAGASPSESAIDVTLTNLLRECGEQNSLVHVQFGTAGCARSFELLHGTQPFASACIASRLETARYACAPEGACGKGLVVVVPIN